MALIPAWGCGLAASGLEVPFSGGAEQANRPGLGRAAAVAAPGDRLASELPGPEEGLRRLAPDERTDQLDPQGAGDVARRDGSGYERQSPDPGAPGGGAGPPSGGSTDLAPDPFAPVSSGAASAGGSTDLVDGPSIGAGGVAGEAPGEPAYPSPGDFVTQPQQAWGAPASDGGPGAYRALHFAAAFPAGLTLGCEGGQRLSLTEASALEALLPQVAPPAVLTQDEIDPPASAAGALAGELVALELSVAFDRLDPDLGASDLALGELVLAKTACGGMSVDEVLELANEVLGACRSDWSATAVAGCLETINLAFVGGASATKALRLP